MARPIRIEFPGAIYHVTSRMIGSWARSRERLFRDARDYQRFLKRLGEGVDTFGIRLYLCTLMSNHYHLVLETPQPNLSRFMQSLSTGYTVYFNKRHRRHGHLLDGRYKAKLVAGDEYLLKLTRYVHHNPVWVSDWARKPIKERITHLRGYRWSSYAGYIGRSEPFEFIDEEPILRLVDGRGKSRRERYRQFVETGLATTDEEFKEALRASPSAIGDEEFLQIAERLRRKGIDKRKVTEDVAFRRVVEPLPAEVVLGCLAEVLDVGEDVFTERRRDSSLRAVAGHCLIRYAGQTQREAARALGMATGAAISAQIKRMPEQLKENPGLARRLRKAECRLEVLRQAAAGKGD